MRAALALLVLASGALACSDEPAATLPDSGIGADAMLVDTGTVAGAPDAGGRPDAQPDSGVIDNCNPVTQTCPGANDKCVVENGGLGALCVPESPNDKMRGEACTGQDCLAGLACVRTSSNTSACVQICDRATGAGCEALGAEYECRTRLTGTNWDACAQLPPACDPYTQAPCAADRGCGPFQHRDLSWDFRCRTPGPQAAGQPCGSAGGGAACMRGLACVAPPQASAVCVKYCQTNGDCTSPSTCTGSVPVPPFMYCSQ